MKLNDTSLKKNNKEELKIEFVPFPGNIKNYEINKSLETKSYKDNTNNKKNLRVFVIIIILLFLFIFSTILNQKLLYGNASNNYNIVNKFDGNYATVKKENRGELLKNIGFDYFGNKLEVLNSNKYNVSYAYNNLNAYDGLMNSISIYYNDIDVVSYIKLNLIYKKSEFSVSKTTSDCNDILKNFVKVNTTKNAISQALNNGYFMLEDIKIKAKVSYAIKGDLGDYYTLTVIVNKGLEN